MLCQIRRFDDGVDTIILTKSPTELQIATIIVPSRAKNYLNDWKHAKVIRCTYVGTDETV